MMRAIGSLFLLAVAACSAAAWYGWHQLYDVVDAVPGTVISVAPGASLRSVAYDLRRIGLVRHPPLFVAWGRFQGAERRIRPGTYRIDGPISAVDILDMLRRGPGPESRWVTIPEGYTARQIAAALEEKGFARSDVFERVMRDPDLLAALVLPASGVEGYLFPDTYSFPLSTDPADIVRAMVRRFRQVSGELTGLRRKSGLGEEEMVILASVIEKETGKAEERPLISGVFHNRLRRGMLLQSDPTVIYGLRQFDGNLTRAHLADDSPYNTYRYPGLPPGPIANPGRAALRAAVDPAPTRALYFVARNDGSHEFSESLRQHNRAVWRYQKSRRRRTAARRNRTRGAK